MKKICILLALLYAPVVGADYKCVDSKGATHISDQPPLACADVVILEVTKNGRVVRRIEPTPTAEQAKARQDDVDKKKEAARAAGEQNRRDLALLNTYTTEREVDVARERNIEPIRGRIKNAQDRLVVVDKREKQVQEEMEFYKAGQSKAGKGGEAVAPPVALVSELERVRSERESLKKGIALHEKEIELLKLKYDQDKQRWLALKSGAVAKPPEFLR